MCTLLLFASTRPMAEPTPFFPPFFPPPEISSFWGTSIAITPSGTQEVLPTPAGRKYLIGSSLLISSPSITLIHPPFSIASLAVAPPLTSPLLPPLLLLGGATGPGFWPSTNSSICLSLSGLSPQRASPFLQFSESSLGWLCLLLWLSLSFSRGIFVSFSFLCCFSFYLYGTECGQIFHSFRRHQTPSKSLVVCWGGKCG